MKIHKNIVVSIILIFIILISCVEKYEPKQTYYEPFLVIEAKITDEFKNHQVKLTKVIPLDSNISIKEEHAQVRIESSDGNIYDFTEIEPGLYQSDIDFMAMPNIEYQLFVETENNEIYHSLKEVLPASVNITNITQELTTHNGVEGVQIMVSSEDNPENNFIKYTYIETYKVTTPYLILTDSEIINFADYSPLCAPDGITSTLDSITRECIRYDIKITPTSTIKNVCYPKEESNNFNLISLTADNVDKIINHPILFIPKDKYYKIRERYSIEISQHAISEETYNYYKILQDLGDIQSIFSEKQNGRVQGNIYTNSNGTENVIGLFEISSVSKSRTFFDYQDLNLIRPSYQYTCEVETLDYYKYVYDGQANPPRLNDRLKIYERLAKYNPPYEVKDTTLILNIYENDTIKELLVDMVKPECGNCSTYASNVVPNFWEE